MAARWPLSLFAFWQPAVRAAGQRALDVIVGDWIPRIPLATAEGIGLFQVGGVPPRPASGVMLLVVTGIGLLIHVYSTAYMPDEPRGGSRGSSAT